jgi:hypothetical protein
MTTSDLDALILRLGSLERSCLRWRAFGACLAAALAVLGLAGAVAPGGRDLTVETLRVVDARGKIRILLSAGEGVAEVAVNDRDEANRILIGVAKDGGAFAMFAEPGTEKNRIMFGVGASGAPLLLMKDPEGVNRLSMGVYAKVGPMVRILDASKKVLVKLP